MTKETRLRLGKIEVERSNVTHPYAIEYLESIKPKEENKVEVKDGSRRR